MNNYFELVLSSENKIAKRLKKAFLPSEEGRKDIIELSSILGIDKDINILTYKDMFILSNLMYILGREEGKRTERKKQNAKFKQLS